MLMQHTLHHRDTQEMQILETRSGVSCVRKTSTGESDINMFVLLPCLVEAMTLSVSDAFKVLVLCSSEAAGLITCNIMHVPA